MSKYVAGTVDATREDEDDPPAPKGPMRHQTMEDEERDEFNLLVFHLLFISDSCYHEAPNSYRW
jgi:hypothetical protein